MKTAAGCYILRPASFGIWERITEFFDREIKKMGVQNACFPLFVTEERLNTEKDHVVGFAAEVPLQLPDVGLEHAELCLSYARRRGSASSWPISMHRAVINLNLHLNLRF